MSYSTPESTASAQSEYQPAPNNAAELGPYLEMLSGKIMMSMDGSPGDDFEIMRTYCAVDYRVTDVFRQLMFDDTTDLEKHISDLTLMRSTIHGWKTLPYNMNAVVDKGLAHAVVWLSSRPSGPPRGHGELSGNRESVHQLCWRKKHDKWECYHHVYIRGGVPFD